MTPGPKDYEPRVQTAEALRGGGRTRPTSIAKEVDAGDGLPYAMRHAGTEGPQP